MERARRAIRTFFLIRDLYLKVTDKPETQLPLANPAPFVQVGNVLDLSEYIIIMYQLSAREFSFYSYSFITSFPNKQAKL